MEDERTKPKVFRVDSKSSWDFHVNQAIAQHSPIVAHFGADWCLPSVAMKPIFEEMASVHEDAVFVTVDVDAAKDIATRYEVKAMPTFLLLKGGDVVDKLVGANPDEFKKRIHTFLQPVPVIEA